MKQFALLLAASVFFSTENFAQPSSLDASFANNGIGFYTIPNELASAICRFSFLQSNGKLVLGGSIDEFLGLVRFKPDGTIDSSFGADGKVLSIPPAGAGVYRAGTIQPDGKFLVTGPVSGTQTDGVLILRYTSGGVPDKSFNGNGQQLISVGDDGGFTQAIALQPDGKIIVAGNCVSGGQVMFAVARLNANGSPDNGFDNDGKKYFAVSGFGREECHAIAVQADGKILLAGTSLDASDNYQFSIARLNTDGSFDNTFNGTGKQIIQVGGSGDRSEANAIALQSNGKILLGGWNLASGTHDYTFAVVRLNQTGTLDNNFDGDGKLTFYIDAVNLNDQANAIAVDANDKIVISGSSYNGTNYDYAIARLKSAGAPDISFDGDGKTTISVGSYSDVAYSMIVTTDKITLAGYSGYVGPSAPGVNMETDLLVYSAARLNFDGTLDNSFDGDGKVLVSTGSLNDEASAAAINANGALFLAGSSLKYYKNQGPSIIRLTPAGLPETSFSDDGRLINAPNSNDGNNYAVLRGAGGNILTAGETLFSQTAKHDFLVSRVTATGVPDATFGVGGFARIDINGADDTATCMALQADGKIVAAGSTSSFLNGTIISVVRLLDNGTPDNTFGTSGKKTFTAAFGACKAYSVAIQTDGKIVLAGFSYTSIGGNYDFLAMRLNTSGTLDNTFGSGGRVTISMSNYNDVCYSMKLQPDGKIVLAGVSGSESSKDFALVRLNTNGSLDNTFDGDGKKVIAVSTNIDIAKSVALQQDGKIVVAGYSYNGKDNDPAVIRLNTDGSPDGTFDGDGLALFNYKGTDEMISSVNVQSDGKIVLAGKQTPQNETYGAGDFVMRLLGGSSPQAIGLEDPNPVDAYLEQNVPNPVIGTTTIGYKISEGFSSAKIVVENRNGILLKEMMIKDHRGKISVDVSAFVPGAYKYVLYVDGKMIGSKQLIVIR